MEKEIIPQYLANILIVSRADGVLSPDEEKAYQDVCADIGGKKRDAKAADKLSSAADVKPVPVGRYSDQIRNLEDMVFTALTDRDLSDSERKVIVAFATEVGLTQDQVNRVVAEGNSRARASAAQGKCPSCSADVPGGSKFCPECGAPIGQAPAKAGKKLSFDYPGTGMSIEFAESSSANFPSALEVAKTAPDFQEIERSKKGWFLTTWPHGEMLKVVDLVEKLKGMRNRKAYADGRELEWDDAFSFIYCLRERRQAYKPVQYCFGADDRGHNVWGCMRLNMEWSSWAKWFSFGTFTSKNVFQFDKKRIQHELETNIHKVRFCPFLRKTLIGAVFQLLPDHVRVAEREGWKYKENYERTPNSIKVVVKERQDGYTFTNEFFADGVRPVGFVMAKRILQQAFKQCSVTDVTAKDLFQ